MLLLESSIGSLDIIDNASQLIENLKLLINDENNENNSKICCLIHNEDIYNTEEKNKNNLHVKINSLLNTQRFSKEFLDLLC